MTTTNHPLKHLNTLTEATEYEDIHLDANLIKKVHHHHKEEEEDHRMEEEEDHRKEEEEDHYPQEHNNKEAKPRTNL